MRQEKSTIGKCQGATCTSVLYGYIFLCILKAHIEVQTSPCCKNFKTLIKIRLNTMAKN